MVIMSSKTISNLTSVARRSSKAHKVSHVDESHAVIINGGAAVGHSREPAIALSNDEADGMDVLDEESVSDSENGTDKENDQGRLSASPAAVANGVHVVAAEDSDVQMNGTVGFPVTQALEEEADNATPSFGDLVTAKSTNPISIAEAVPSVESNALVSAQPSKPVTIPSGISLSTVLSQALRTNDNNLLESCFHNTDTQIVRSTIQRIDSSLAGILIQKLAERLSSRPGRYGHLLVWVQWICVAHGGAIASQPDISSKIKTLYNVLNQRSKALESLLLLKGKLDMLDAQLSLRKQLRRDRDPLREADEGHVVYIEGEGDSDSSDEDASMDDTGITTPPASKSKAKRNMQELIPVHEEESEDDEDMPVTNGVVAESDGSEFDSEEGEGGHLEQRTGRLVDDEAEDSDEDSHPSDREDSDSEEETLNDDEDEGDSEMDDFIDDGPIEEAESASEISIDEPPEKPPPKKKNKRC